MLVASLLSHADVTGRCSCLQAAGTTFAAVHDSYWTHASTIDQMSAYIRDTFIELHSSDVLQRLEAEVGHPCAMFA